jgi:hypothetical protein
MYFGKYGVFIQRIPFSHSKLSEGSTFFSFSTTAQKYELLAFINDDAESHSHK